MKIFLNKYLIFVLVIIKNKQKIILINKIKNNKMKKCKK